MSGKGENSISNDPLVSVIMPVYNRADTIRRAVDSVLNQDWKNLELIVVDDGSNDDSVKILESYGDSLNLITQENQGAYFARNHALKFVNGEFIAFIDSDDYWLPHRISSQIPLFDRSKIGLVFGNARVERRGHDGNANKLSNFFNCFPPSRGKVTKELCFQNFIPQSSVIIRRECYNRFAGFFTGNKRASDYVKWFELSLYFEFDYVPEPVFVYCLHDSNLSGSIEALLSPPIEGFQELLMKSKLNSNQRYFTHLVIYRFQTWFSLLLMLKMLNRIFAGFASGGRAGLGIIDRISTLFNEFRSAVLLRRKRG